MIFSIASVAILAILPISSVLAQNDTDQLIWNYPTNPHNRWVSKTTWSDGVSPYTFNILSPDLSTTYFSYTGKLKAAAWNFVGCDSVIFQLSDSNGSNYQSPVIPVAKPIALSNLPAIIPQAESYTFHFEGGQAPWILKVLTNLGHLIWQSDAEYLPSATWPMKNISIGTSLRFNLSDQVAYTKTDVITTVVTPESYAFGTSNLTSAAPQTSSTQSTSTQDSGQIAIVGGVAGGILALTIALLIAGLLFLNRRQQKMNKEEDYVLNAVLSKVQLDPTRAKKRYAESDGQSTVIGGAMSLSDVRSGAGSPVSSFYDPRTRLTRQFQSFEATSLGPLPEDQLYSGSSAQPNFPPSLDEGRPRLAALRSHDAASFSSAAPTYTSRPPFTVAHSDSGR